MKANPWKIRKYSNVTFLRNHKVKLNLRLETFKSSTFHQTIIPRHFKVELPSQHTAELEHWKVHGYQDYPYKYTDNHYDKGFHNGG